MDITKVYAIESIQERARQLVLENMQEKEEAIEYLDGLFADKPKDLDDYAVENADSSVPVYTWDLYEWLHANWAKRQDEIQEAIETSPPEKGMDGIIGLAICIFRMNINVEANRYVKRAYEESQF